MHAPVMVRMRGNVIFFTVNRQATLASCIYLVKFSNQLHVFQKPFKIVRQTECSLLL